MLQFARVAALITLAAMASCVWAQTEEPESLKLIAPDGGRYHIFGSAVAATPEVTVVGAYGASIDGSYSGAAYVFDATSGSHVATLTPGDARDNMGFGKAVAVDGNIAVIGAPGEDRAGSSTGAAYVFDLTTSQQLFKLALPDGAENDEFGLAVAIAGNVVLIAAPFRSEGDAYGVVYVYDAGTGQRLAELEPSDGGGTYNFGWSVAARDNRAVIGTPGNGPVRVFELTSFQQIDDLVPANGDTGDRFGWSVAIEDDVVAVGVPSWDDPASQAGLVYQFDVVSGQQVRQFAPDDGAANDQFGWSVALDGGELVVGAWRATRGADGTGAAYRFDTGTGQQLSRLTPTDGAEGDNFGWSVAAAGPVAVVGAVGDDDSGESSGSAYVFGPAEGDLDGDGLLDSWESEGGGIDINGDGTIDLDLYALGARHDSKDLFVEVDLMQDAPFLIESIEDVVDTFANAPVTNPDGSEGIRLHVDTGTMDVVGSAEYWDDDFVAFDIAKDQFFGTEAQRNSGNAEHILAAKKRVYRYCIFAKQMIDGSLGIAERPGNDFYVTLGSLSEARVTASRPWSWWIAHVFMHELGHNLGLTHGGGHDIDGDDPDNPTYVANYKPNYISCMNYGFDSIRFVNADGALAPLDVDFSREAMIPLNESNLSEPVGIPSDEYAEVMVPFGALQDDGTTRIAWAILDDPEGIDWNDDTDWDDSGVTQDVTFYGDQRPQYGTPTPGDTLNGFNDWAIIELPIGTDGDFADYTHGTIDYEEINAEVLDWHADNVPPPPGGCRVDMNEDLVIDTRDVLRFLNLWSAELGAADFNLDGSVNTLDVLSFLNAWTAGC